MRDPAARRGRRAGFTLIEVLAALVVTGAFVAVVLPYAGRLASHWWAGEAAVEAADQWMQAVARMGDDLSQAVPYGLGADGLGGAAFRAGPDGIAFVRPGLGDAGGLDAVAYEIRSGRDGATLVRRSRRFDPDGFGGGIGGTPSTLIAGPYRLRLVEVASDGSRRRDWSPGDGMPAAVELSASAEPPGRRAMLPVGPVLMPIAARAPAAARSAAAATAAAGALPTAGTAP